MCHNQGKQITYIMKDEKKILLRIDAETANEVKKLADLNDRSVNGQINFLLKQSLKINK